MVHNNKPNKLINEKSPYLIQHAYNPVDWYPWGKEPFEKARKEDKPVFLSIGYSTCHWCHVMAHESFENEQVAQILNRDFVSIKVDREERPDIDAVYMSVCQAFNGTGGWPLTILMDGEQKPFWAGTYLPMSSRYGMGGLIELLTQVARGWKSSDRQKMREAGESIASFLKKQETAKPDLIRPDKELLRAGVEAFRANYDARWGGFSDMPKFPAAHNLLFLMRYGLLEKDAHALEMSDHTLEQMYRGGLFDHVGGGFSRYSTDEEWLVPHFEKTLYDNALLALAYLEAYRINKRPLFMGIVRRILDFVLRELTDPNGGFYCGQDADSDGVEGKYYVFTPEEIIREIGEADGRLFCAHYNITKSGNFEGKSIPSLIYCSDIDAKNTAIEQITEKIYAYRRTRTRLHTDDKVLLSWNALMITAFARAAFLLDEPGYLAAAQKARSFIDEHMKDAHARLYLRWREGEAAYPAHLDDYAFYAMALLELYNVTFDADNLVRALEVSGQMLELFSDPSGGFFFYARDSERLIGRPKEIYDAAMPSGNAAAGLVLCGLAQLTGAQKWKEARDNQLLFLAGAAKEIPMASSAALLALTRTLYPSGELICAARGSLVPDTLKAFLKKHDILNLSVILKNDKSKALLARILPETDHYPIPADLPVYYFCKNGACQAPTENLGNILRLLP